MDFVKNIYLGKTEKLPLWETSHVLRAKSRLGHGSVMPRAPASHPGQALLKEQKTIPVPPRLWMETHALHFFGVLGFFGVRVFPPQEEWHCGGARSCAKPRGAEHQELVRPECPASPCRARPHAGAHVAASHRIVPATPRYGHCPRSDSGVPTPVPHVRR